MFIHSVVSSCEVVSRIDQAVSWTLLQWLMKDGVHSRLHIGVFYFYWRRYPIRRIQQLLVSLLKEGSLKWGERNCLCFKTVAGGFDSPTLHSTSTAPINMMKCSDCRLIQYSTVLGKLIDELSIPCHSLKCCLT